MTPKYRPSLSAEEIADCIESLELSLPSSTALGVLKLFQMKQSLGKVVPTNASRLTVGRPVAVETAEEREAREANELAAETAKLNEWMKDRNSSLADSL